MSIQSVSITHRLYIKKRLAVTADDCVAGYQESIDSSSLAPVHFRLIATANHQSCCVQTPLLKIPAYLLKLALFWSEASSWTSRPTMVFNRYQGGASSKLLFALGCIPDFYSHHTTVVVLFIIHQV
jgi:hypothetical protein